MKRIGKEVILFGNDGCIYCVKTKEWLNENNIAYVEKDVSVNANSEELNKFNVPGIPLVVVIDKETNQRTLINGYLPSKLEKELLS